MIQGSEKAGLVCRATKLKKGLASIGENHPRVDRCHSPHGGRSQNQPFGGVFGFTFVVTVVTAVDFGPLVTIVFEVVAP